VKSLKELREDRGRVVKEMQDFNEAISAESRSWTAEEDEKWIRFNADVDNIGKDIERQERLDELNATLQDRVDQILPGRDATDFDKKKEVATTAEEDRSLALKGWMCRQTGVDVRAEYAEAAKRAKINIGGNYFDVDLHKRALQNSFEVRALSVVSGSAGEFTIAEGFVNNIERALLQFGGMRQLSEILRTSKGNDLPWPTSDDTSNRGVLIAENTTVAEQDVTFGQLILKAYKYSSNLVKVPVELLEDSEFALASWLGGVLGERLGRILNEHFTTGTGASQPNGIVTASTLGITTAGATVITDDEIVNLEHSVDPAYRTQPNAGWMMHDNVLLAVRKLKDNDGLYIWRAGLELGRPDRLLGYPIVVNQDMSSTITSGDITILFGDLGKYKIRDVSSIRMRRLVERFADTDQEGFVSFMRADGNLLDAGTNPVKHLVQV